MSRRVLVGMSGGVDSCVAAALLAEAGDDVIGVSLQLYDHSEAGRKTRCCSPEDFLDARKVASVFGFPYYVINREEAFTRHVLDNFVDEYRRGRTPNPCVRCNAGVKFETLTKLAHELGADAVATGHYARLAADPATGRPRLRRARDDGKDQSYFLFDLSPEQLDRAVFPLGEKTKSEVRAHAVRLGLSMADKPESQDVCFVEGGDYREFLARRLAAGGQKEPAGEIVDNQGAVLARHTGLSGFTVGQRRGLGVSTGDKLYVIRLDARSNHVVLGGEDELMCSALTLSGTRIHHPRSAGSPGSFPARVSVRYRHAGAEAIVVPHDDTRSTIRFAQPLRGASPGQAAVFYEGDVVLGGGWIDTVSPS